MTWVPVPAGSPFPVQNLAFGVFSRDGQPPRVGVAIGVNVLDLSRLDVPFAADFAEPALNPFMARGRAAWSALRARLQQLLSDPAHRSAVEPHLIALADVALHLPFEVADYIDFYSSEHHARNVGAIFRPGGEPLSPNWKHMPIGYHGRAGTVVVSGTPIRRPRGQSRPAPGEPPVFGPCQRLDIEAEVGFVVGTPAPDGQVSTADFAEHVFGVVLLNDWSARDLQAWESTPLGPFLCKSFATSISPWVVPLEALEVARVAPPEHEVLPYLHTVEPWGLDVELAVQWNGTVVTRPPFAQMYWTAAQQLAHLTVNGASLRTGDLFASGTVSGPRVEQRGCLLELTWNGRDPVHLDDGTLRTFLEDGDEVVITAAAPGADGFTIGFGEVRGAVLPASTKGHCVT
jgi:fumarylacetoacetase